MLTKKELYKTYIKYSKDITEEIFNKIYNKLEQLGIPPYHNEKYNDFKNNFPYVRIDKDFQIAELIGDYKEIQVSDILGEGWNTKEKQYDYEVVHCTSQEEWDFVHKKVNSKINNWFADKEYGNNKSFCIDINNKFNSNSLEKYQEQKNVKIYSFQEWCDKFNHKPDFNKSKFEVGKWYKHFLYEGTYAKFLKIDNKWRGSEWIDDEGEYKHELFGTSKYDNTHEVSLEEIQQYLPDNHPDKIKTDKIMDKNELLAEAKRRYPVGCIIESPYSCKKFEIVSYSKFGITNNNIHYNSFYYLYYKGKWAKIISKPKESKSKFKFEIGDIIDTDENGYQYTSMDKLSKQSTTNWKVIKNCNCKTKSKIGCEITDKVYSPYTKSWWYKVIGYSNWISENCMSLSNTEKETPKKWSIGTYIVIINPKNMLTSLNKGEILTIKEEVNDLGCILSFQEIHTPISISREEDGEIKWFATYDEAKEFSDSLLDNNKLDKTWLEEQEEHIFGVDPYDEFVLPNKWKVKYDKNTKPLLDKWKNFKGADMDYGDLTLAEWCISDSLHDNSYMLYSDNKEYTEITFEQFKKYVYDKEVSKEPFIKGYSWEGMSDLVSTPLTLKESFKTTQVKQLPTKSWI